MTASSHVRSTASRAADSKPLEYLARGGFIAYGIIHLIFAWIALQLAFGDSAGESDQSGALQTLAKQPMGKTLVVATVVGMIGLALWQAFEAAIGESGKQDRTALAERFISGCRTILYLYFAWLGIKVLRGANASTGDSQQRNASSLMDSGGGRFLVGLIGVIVIGVGIGLVIYGVKKKFEKHLNTQQMSPSVRRTTRRLGVAGYSSKGVAYGIAGGLIVAAAVTYDPGKARGLDAALKTLAGQEYGPWLLGLIALGIAAFGIYCFFQVRYRKV
ncbi:hypothetical protein Asp14428_71110 [Actinoplanes sp. NBRC 14428]|uniref:Uncharacterized protein DUF1206 n=1 Tax=Pseudosporangium ferrugineum TaxID=439699 RepID=A0A2T0S2F5_9ACTN|nr:DUF1206 domain-containing protein [Pseudosporangium ferrugineum]PRY27594.1 uncharacterized protein DUF1206 [Pseudosporangium ferrugineum]BCJ55636.1 hypothetical protein Asp14428_71110 [Actinoplanes sp. NBRC 14428]